MPQIAVCSTSSAADSNATALSVCRECEPTVATKWTNMQPNEISDFSPKIDTTARNPLSLDRNNRKGTITGLTAEPGFTSDTFMDVLRYFGDAFLYSVWKGAAPFGMEPSGVTATGYTVASGGAIAAGTLVYASGFAVAANNGLKVVTSGSTATEIKVSGLTAEATTTGDLHIVGVQAASGDITVNAAGNLTSTVLDFTTLGLTVGQHIHIGGATAGLKFATAADYGLARVEGISAHLLTLGNKQTAFAADIGTSITLQLFFGSFVRNVSVSDADFQRVRHTMEVRYNTAPVVYEYARDAYANTLSLAFPNEDKSTIELGFIAKDIEAPTSTRKSGASWSDMTQATAFNTVSDFCRLRVVESDPLGMDTYFKDTTIKIDNGASGETVLGNLGAAFVNLGNFGVTLDTETVMVNGAVLAAIRSNETVSMTMGLRNQDGGFVLDIPAMTLGDGSKNISEGEKVKIKTTGEVFKSDRLGYSLGLSLFGYLPADSV